MGDSDHFALAQHATTAELSNVCSNVGYLVGMLEEALKQLENNKAPLSTHREALELKPQRLSLRVMV